MNFYEFINSRSIAKHLEKINYNFNTKEAAYVVWQSKFTTLKQKFEAWQHIIDTMPDQSVELRQYGGVIDDVPSFHNVLREYISIARKLIDNFYDSTDAVYFYGVLYEDCNDWNNGNEATPYRYVHRCVEKMNPNKNLPIKAYRITKRRIDDKDNYIQLIFDGQGEVLNFDVGVHALGSREFDLVNYFFESLWIGLPTPFKSGDIVYCVKGVLESQQKTPFVLTSICSWSGRETAQNKNIGEDEIKRIDQRIECYKKTGDIGDMFVCGYFIQLDGQILADETWCYLDLEYYNEQLTSYSKALTPISLYLKGEIDLSLLLDAYEAVRKQNDARIIAGDYSECTRQLLGLT